jgi:hypothetical protein
MQYSFSGTVGLLELVSEKHCLETADKLMDQEHKDVVLACAGLARKPEVVMFDWVGAQFDSYDTFMMVAVLLPNDALQNHKARVQDSPGSGYFTWPRRNMYVVKLFRQVQRGWTAQIPSQEEKPRATTTDGASPVYIRMPCFYVAPKSALSEEDRDYISEVGEMIFP